MVSSHTYSASTKYTGAIKDDAKFTQLEYVENLTYIIKNSYTSKNSDTTMKFKGASVLVEEPLLFDLIIPPVSSGINGMNGRNIKIEQVILGYQVSTSASEIHYIFRRTPTLSGVDDCYYNFFKADDEDFGTKNENGDFVSSKVVASGTAKDVTIDITNYADEILLNHKFSIFVHKSDGTESDVTKSSVNLNVIYHILPLSFISNFNLINDPVSGSILLDWNDYDTSSENGEPSVAYYNIYYSLKPFSFTSESGVTKINGDYTHEHIVEKKYTIDYLEDGEIYFFAIEPVILLNGFSTSNTVVTITKEIKVSYPFMTNLTAEMDTKKKCVTLRYHQFDIPDNFLKFSIYRNSKQFDSIEDFYTQKFKDDISVYEDYILEQLYEDYFIDLKSNYYYCIAVENTSNKLKENDLQMVSITGSIPNSPSLKIEQVGGIGEISWEKTFDINHLFVKYILQRSDLSDDNWVDLITLGYVYDELTSPSNWENYGANYDAVNDRFSFVDDAIIKFNNDFVVNSDTKNSYFSFKITKTGTGTINVFSRYNENNGTNILTSIMDVSSYIYDNMTTASDGNGTWTAVSGCTISFPSSYMRVYSNAGYSLVLLTGTVSMNVLSKIVYGTGTLFTTELSEGDKILPFGGVGSYRVDTIVSDTILTLTTTAENFTGVCTKVRLMVSQFYKEYSTYKFNNYETIRVSYKNLYSVDSTMYLKLTSDDLNTVYYTETINLPGGASTFSNYDFDIPNWFRNKHKVGRIDVFISCPVTLSEYAEVHIDYLAFYSFVYNSDNCYKIKVKASEWNINDFYENYLFYRAISSDESIVTVLYRENTMNIFLVESGYSYDADYDFLSIYDVRFSKYSGVVCLQVESMTGTLYIDDIYVISPDILSYIDNIIEQSDIDDVNPEDDVENNYKYRLITYCSEDMTHTYWMKFRYTNDKINSYMSNVVNLSSTDMSKLPQPVTILSYTPYYNQTTGKYQIQLEWDWLEDSMDDADFEQWEIRMTEDSDNNPDLEDDIALSGTITMSASDMLVHGGSTKFTTELKVGNTIYPTGSTSLYEIASITSDTELVLTTNGEAATSVAGYKSTLYGVVTNVNQKSTTVPHTGYGSLIPASNYKIAVITVDKAGLKRYSGESE